MHKLALLSTGIGVFPSIMRIVRELGPQVEITNFVDDGIIRDIAAHGDVVQPGTFKRLLNLVSSAELGGAQALLVTCSSISEFVDHARPFTNIPLFKIDEPMGLEALKRGIRIGVAATVSTTLAPSLRLLQRLAREQRKEAVLTHRLVSPAFEAFQRGETDLHDGLVSESILELCGLCDVVLLAQASMMSVVARLDEPYQRKILSSPYLGVKAVLCAMGWL